MTNAIIAKVVGVVLQGLNKKLWSAYFTVYSESGDRWMTLTVGLYQLL